MSKSRKQNPTPSQIRAHQYKQSKNTPLVQALRARDLEVHDGARTK